jgi:hypothetical protein
MKGVGVVQNRGGGGREREKREREREREVQNKGGGEGVVYKMRLEGGVLVVYNQGACVWYGDALLVGGIS